MEMPDSDHLPSPYVFRVGEQVGMTFNLGHRKYVFAAKVVRMEAYSIDNDTEATSLKLICSGEKHRVERRLHRRSDLPSRHIARARFWLGGCGARPAAGSRTSPIWPGSILNMSHGGMLVRATFDAVKCVEIGDVVGIHITLGGEEAAMVDGQLRHCAGDGEMALIGVQFLEASQSVETVASLERIRQRMETLLSEGSDKQAEPAPEAAAVGQGREDGSLAVH